MINQLINQLIDQAKEIVANSNGVKLQGALSQVANRISMDDVKAIIRDTLPEKRAAKYIAGNEAGTRDFSDNVLRNVVFNALNAGAR